MIVYSALKKQFLEDVDKNEIDVKILEAMRLRLKRSVSPKEIESWVNSMQFMYKILLDGDIPNNSGVSIEYSIPMTSKRVDFILSGKDAQNRDSAIIIELKQWKEAHKTKLDGIVRTFVGGSEREVSHPSYQAWSYAALLTDFNEAVQEGEISLIPCAYLHNCESREAINDLFYKEYTAKAPSFLKRDSQKLNEFIKKYIKHGDSGNIMFRIDHGKIKPSKNLADALSSMLSGNGEFVLIDDQKLVYETAVHLALASVAGKKNVLIVEGGPGTGKSVVAINLLVELTKQNMLAQYVSKNAAPRSVYAAKLAGTFRRNRIEAMFQGSGAYTESTVNMFDALIVDEAHRLNEKSGMFSHLGENQVKEIIHASKLSIFFIDEDQRVTFKDVGSKEEIRKWAKSSKATVHELSLQSQFRCNGSDGYLAWLDSSLQIRETANETLEEIDYEFEVFSDPNELRRKVFEKNRLNNKARMVAGYCWNWISKGKPKEMDIVIPEHGFEAQWNLAKDGSLWIMAPESVSEIGCIHTCQGLELDYIGVIIGPDFIVRDGKVICDGNKRAKTDKSIQGYKKLFKEDKTKANEKAEAIIKNTYRTLMTRGQKGCYLYCADPETNTYFAKLVDEVKQERERTPQEKYPGLNLRLLPEKEVKPYINAVPVYDLKIAAGDFSAYQVAGDFDWVELPEHIRIAEGYFVAQVLGESMNKRIPNGSWCLFKSNPAGSRDGKVVLVQHRDIQDVEMGGHYTVKEYHSEKSDTGDGSWMHTQIILKPKTSALGYKDIVLKAEHVEGLYVVGEFVAALG